MALTNHRPQWLYLRLNLTAITRSSLTMIKGFSAFCVRLLFFFLFLFSRASKKEDFLLTAKRTERVDYIQDMDYVFEPADAERSSRNMRSIVHGSRDAIDATMKILIPVGNAAPTPIVVQCCALPTAGSSSFRATRGMSIPRHLPNSTPHLISFFSGVECGDRRRQKPASLDKPVILCRRRLVKCVLPSSETESPR
jgi:hypothetical protein